MRIIILPSKNTTLVLLLLFLLASTVITAQTRVFATTVSSENEVNFSGNAIDADLLTKADIRASSGIALGIGAYAGHLELQFPTTLPQNTTSYIKVDTEED